MVRTLPKREIVPIKQGPDLPKREIVPIDRGPDSARGELDLDR